MRHSCPHLALLLALASCGAPSTSAFRYAGLVDQTVIRALTVEGAELPPEVLARGRAEAVESIAGSVDGLEAAEVEDLRLDIAIAEIQETSSSVRVRCLVTLHTVGPPERTRTILEGAVSVGGGGEGALEEAIVRSIRSALRRLPQALAAL